MRKVISFLFFCLFFSSCSRIGFHTGEDSPQGFEIDYKFNSTLEECNANDEACVSNVQHTPFLKGVRESQPGHLTEYFEISIRNELEILFILDVSDSMNDNLKKTGKNMEALLSYIHDKDWQMAFTTADHGDHDKKSSERWENYRGSLPRFGKLMKLEKEGRVLNQFVLDQNTSGYNQVFKDTLTRGPVCNLPPYCQGNNEQPLRALKAAINRYQTDPQNKKFFKPGVDTMALIITDEDERRNDVQNATKAEEVMATYDRVFAHQRKRLFGFSVSIQDEQCYNSERGFLQLTGAAYGHIVGRLAELTGGRNVSLCTESYGSAFTDISKITRSLVQSLVLQKIFYIPETVKVSLFPPQPHVSWKLYGRKIVFSEDIQEGTKIAVSYQYE
jgi:hypothetical protein